MRRIFIYIGSVLLALGLGFGFIPISGGGDDCGSLFVAGAAPSVEPIPTTVVSSEDLVDYDAQRDFAAAAKNIACADARTGSLVFIIPLALLGFLVLGSALVYRRPAATRIN